MDAIEFFQAIQNGAEFRVDDIPRLIEEEYEQINARLMFADFVGASGKSHLLYPLTADKFNPAQPRDWRGRWTSTGAGGGAGDLGDIKKMPFSELARRVSMGTEELLRTGKPMTPEDSQLLLSMGGEVSEREKRVAGYPDDFLKSERAEIEKVKEWRGGVDKMSIAEMYYETALTREIEGREKGTYKPISEGGKPWEMSYSEMSSRVARLDFEQMRKEAGEVEAAREEYYKLRPKSDKDGYSSIEELEAWEEGVAQYDKYLKEVTYRGKMELAQEIARADTDEKLIEIAQKFDNPTADFDHMMRREINRELERRIVKREQEETAKKAGDYKRERLAQIEKLGLKDKTPYIGEYMVDVQNATAEAYTLPRGTELKTWKDEIRASDVGIAFNHEIAPYIVEQGFLNQHETGSSGGLLDNDSRSTLETGLWDLSDKTTREYPIYGFLTEPNGTLLQAQSSTIRQYGDMVAILNPEMDEHTTITVGDSLNNNHWFMDGDASSADFSNSRVPVPKLDPHETALAETYSNNGEVAATPRFVNDGMDGIEYIEAQIHGGGVTIDKIKEIRVPYSKDILMLDGDRYRAAKSFATAGIPVFVFGKGGEGGWVTLTAAEFARYEKELEESDGELLAELMG